jgi:hypothetical protein
MSFVAFYGSKKRKKTYLFYLRTYWLVEDIFRTETLPCRQIRWDLLHIVHLICHLGHLYHYRVSIVRDVLFHFYLLPLFFLLGVLPKWDMRGFYWRVLSGFLTSHSFNVTFLTLGLQLTVTSGFGRNPVNREIASSSGASEHQDIFPPDFFQFSFLKKTWKNMI